MIPPRDLQTVKQAKPRFAQRYRSLPGCTGIGIAPQADGYVLRINIDPEAVAEADVPEEFEGVPVRVLRIGAYRAR